MSKQYRIVALLLCAVMLLSLLPGVAAAAPARRTMEDELPIIPIGPDDPKPTNPFTDVVPRTFYYDAVLWAVGKQITNGMTETTFEPEGPCTRGQVVTFLWRTRGSPAPGTTGNPFTDVPTGKFYTQAVLWAVRYGITNGMTATTFEPDGLCTRGQVVTFLWRAKGRPSSGIIAGNDELPVVSGSTFTDVVRGSYYEQAVNWAVTAGVTKGMTDTTFCPDLTCTRAHVVTFLYRAFG